VGASVAAHGRRSGAGSHDTHHPLGPSLYYEDQRVPQKKRSEEFWTERVPKYLGYFERILKSSSGA